MSIIEEIEKHLKNALEIKDGIEEDEEYRQFLNDLKDLSKTEEIKNLPKSNPFIFLLKRLPPKYHKHIDRMYQSYYSKFSKEYAKGDINYIGERLLSENGTLTVDLEKWKDPLAEDLFEAYCMGLIYYGAIYKSAGLSSKNISLSGDG